MKLNKLNSFKRNPHTNYFTKQIQLTAADSKLKQSQLRPNAIISLDDNKLAKKTIK